MKRENCAMVLVRKRIAIIAVRMVKGAASPAPCTITAKPKKKLIAGAMLARVDATIWLRESASRRNRVSPSSEIFILVMVQYLSLFVEIKPKYASHYVPYRTGLIMSAKEKKRAGRT